MFDKIFQKNPKEFQKNSKRISQEFQNLIYRMIGETFEIPE
jgi:hypothetical protein